MAKRESMKEKKNLWSVLRQIHNDEDGEVSLETVLVVGAIALPVLIFLITVAWPAIKNFFYQGMEDLDAGRTNAVIE